MGGSGTVGMKKAQPGCYVLEDMTLDDISRLAHPEHCVRLPRDAHRINVKAVWGLFSLLESDVICHNDVCEESLELGDREEATRADKEI